MFNVEKYIHLIIICLVLTINVTAQTPGLIIKPATGGGAAVLDPDADGYVSQKINGIQNGFTIPPDNDVLQSEIPYVALVRPDVQGDLAKGPIGGFTEIVGTDAAGNNAILTYSDNNYLYYRFRLSGYASNSKSYSILIDTDQKFGFTGPNADPNAVSGNPGFEAEIVLETNFNVYAYNVDGSAMRPATATASAPYDTNCQKSVAISNAGGDADYFYDFYIPYPTSLFTKTSLLRYVALTSMNPKPAIGNNAVSDVGGVGAFTNLDQAFTDLINAQTPTTPGGEVLDRTACPSINPVSVADATISGTTVGVNTIIKVSVYQSNGTTLVCQAGLPPTTNSNWSIPITSLCPLQLGYKIKATATAPGMGVSYDNCDIETVISTPCNIQAPSTIGFSNSDKNIDVTFSSAVTGTVTVYNSNGTIWKTQVITNSLTTTLSGGNPLTGNGKIPTGSYYATLTVGSCESGRVYNCLNTTTASGNPIISPITLGSSTITGTQGIAGATIIIYANGNQIATTISGAGTWTANVSNLILCQSITAKQVEAGKCISAASTAVNVTRAAATPTILNSGCFSSPGTISGTSAEIGAIVTLYKTSPSSSTLGTATVAPNGTWNISGLSLNNGDVIAAAITSGSCLTASENSTPVTISTQTNISSYTITFNPVIEKQTSVTGTISGISSPVTLNLYVDGAYVGSTGVNSSGNWSVTGLSSFDLAVGSTVQVTITGTGCESALSSTSAIVQCLPPVMPAYTGGSKSYCIGGIGMLALTASEVGVIYQLVNGSGIAQGPAASGTGSGINLYTNIISTDLNGLYVKAYKIGNNGCTLISGTVINFDTETPSPSVTFQNVSLSVPRGNTSVALPYTAKSTDPLYSADKYTVDYSLAANNQGFLDVTTQTAIPASSISLVVPATATVGNYSGTITIYSNNPLACTSSYSFNITVYQSGSAPVISTQPLNKTICSGGTTILSVIASGIVTGYQWQSSTSFGGPYSNITAGVGSGITTASYTTAALTVTTYYRVIVSNTYGSVTSNVATVTVTAPVAAAGAISGSLTVCTGQNGVNYSVGTIANAISYTWTYSGTGVFINGTGSSVYLNFGSNATSGTLSVAGINSCGSGTAATYVITVNPPMSAIAGINITTCSNTGAVNITSGASASNYNSVTWTSSGTGTFASATSLTDATYTPSAADNTAGSVTLTLTAIGGCGNTTSTKTLTIYAIPNPSEITIN